MAPLITAVSKPNRSPPIAATAAGRYKYRFDPVSGRTVSCVSVGFILVLRMLSATRGFLHCEKSLLQEDQPRCAGNTTVSDCLLKNDRNLSAQQNAGTALDLLVQRRKQLRPCRCDVSPKNEQLRIEHVQEAYQCRDERLKSQIQHATRTWVSLGCRLKDSLSRGDAASIIDRQERRGGTMNMARVSRLDSAGRKASLETSVIAANAKPAADVEGYVPEVAGRSRGSADDHAIDERRAADSGAQGKQNNVAPPSCSPPKNLGH